LAGCQLVAKLETRKEDPLPDGCQLPTGGDASIRLLNLLPAPDAVDFCVKSSADAAYSRPLLRSAGRQCPEGLSFKDVTRAVGLGGVAKPSGALTIDVLAVPASQHACKGTQLAELKGLTLAAGTTSLMLVGGGGESTRLVAHLEDAALDSAQALKIRF